MEKTLEQRIQNVHNCVSGSDSDRIMDWVEVIRLAKLGAAVEAIKAKHPPTEKIRAAIGVINLLYPGNEQK